MPLDLILGAQWGDEGKGRITDLLAAEADIVARFSGGDNAGHTVTVGDQLTKLHLIPSGILQPHTICMMGSSMVVNPAKLVEELDRLKSLGVDVSPNRLLLSSAAHIITPAHIALDGAQESGRGEEQLGTTQRGIGPAYTDKAARRGIRAGDMRRPEAFADKIEQHMHESAEILEKIYKAEAPDPSKAAADYAAFAGRLQPYLEDVGARIAQALSSGKNILAEGAQGTLLDLEHGTYPYVTSSHPTTAGALLGLGVGPQHLRRIIGVAKAFQTRVGSGPFPTEASGGVAQHLRGTGENPWDEYGTTTGRPRRCGWLDLPLLRYALRVNGLTELALTKLDVLTGLDPIQLCVGYEHADERLEEPREGPSDLSPYAPLYQDLPGWREDLMSCRAWDELPRNAQAYVREVEEQTGMMVRLISVGPERDQIIQRNPSR
jgi:adenylosuccinate synthase